MCDNQNILISYAVSPLAEILIQANMNVAFNI